MGQQIQCRSCKAKIQAEDVNLDRMLAKCRACNAIFDFSSQVDAPPASSPAKAKRDKGEIPLPGRLKVEEWGNSITITRKWKSGLGCFFLVFAGFWNTIVTIVVGGFMFADPDSVDNEMGAFIYVFFTPFILVGATMLYLALAFLLNRTVVKADNRELIVKHGPLPWAGNRTLDVMDIKQLYCLEYVAYSQNRVPQYRCSVNAVMSDGSKIPVVKGADDADQALYMEYALERHMGIKDEAVRGEL